MKETYIIHQKDRNPLLIVYQMESTKDCVRIFRYAK